MVEVRLRTRIHPDDMEARVGKILGHEDYSLLVTDTAKLYKPNGQVLAVYLRNAIPQEMSDHAFEILSPIKLSTNNRGLASGSERKSVRGQSYAAPIDSGVIGSFDPQGGRFPYCRLTAWTGKNADQFSELYPYFQVIADLFKQHVPERYEVQMEAVHKTHKEWVIGSTPYTTVTVNNTYATGVHKDAGDLEAGMVNMNVLRRGTYDGGQLVFPEFRTAVDMRDRDVILFDAHEWHGNVELTNKSEDAERISTVLYFRTNMMNCGTAEEEAEKAKTKTGAIKA